MSETMPGIESTETLAGYARRRWPWWAALSTLVTLIALQHSFAAGRLTADLTYDDVGYFVDGVQRLDDIYGQGLAGFVRRYRAEPPHSPFSSLLAAASFALLGVHDWAPYAGDLLLVLVAVAAADCLLRAVPATPRALCLLLLCTTPIVVVAVQEFRPDTACGLFTALGVVAALRGGFSRAGWKRHALIGLLFGVALFTKPTTCPFTAGMAVVAVVLAGACDFLERPGQTTLKQWFGRACVCGLVAVLLALPHYALAWKHIYDYIHKVLYGEHAEELRLSNGQPFDPWLHITGGSGQMMLGWRLFLFAGAWLVGVSVLASRRRAGLLPLLALGLTTIPAVVVPTNTKVNNAFFAATFHWLVVYAGLEGIRAVYLGAADRFAQRPPLALFCTSFLAVIVPASSFFRELAPVDTNRSAAQASREITATIFNDIRNHCRWNKFPLVLTIVNDANYVHSFKLQWLSYREGSPFRACAPGLGADLERCRQLFAVADFVLAGAPAHPGGAWPDAFMSEQLASQMLQVARDDHDFREVGRYELSDKLVYYLFERRRPFGGWTYTSGLTPFEGPYPQWRLPVVAWGTGAETLLAFGSPSPSTYRLVLSYRTPLKDQAITVLLDGKELARRTLVPSEQFSELEVPLMVGAGAHTVILRYAVQDPHNQVTVLFRRLEITTARPKDDAR